MKYNLHDVMSKAWEIYHANKQPNGLRPVFSICLEMAWEHVKNSNILNQWQAMSEKEQINMLTACVKQRTRSDTARKITTCSITRLWPGCCPIMDWMALSMRHG